MPALLVAVVVPTGVASAVDVPGVQPPPVPTVIPVPPVPAPEPPKLPLPDVPKVPAPDVPAAPVPDVPKLPAPDVALGMAPSGSAGSGCSKRRRPRSGAERLRGRRRAGPGRRFRRGRGERAERSEHDRRRRGRGEQAEPREHYRRRRGRGERAERSEHDRRRRGHDGGRRRPPPSRRAAARARARATTTKPSPAARERRLRHVVERLSGCLGSVAAGARRVLVLRAGVGPCRPLSRRAVAARLDATPRQVARSERRGVRQLRAAARAGGCGFEPAAAAVTGAVSAPATPASASSDPSAAGGGADGELVGTARSDVRDAFERGPGSAPAILAPPATGGGADPLLLLFLLLAFVTGFAAVWAVQSRAGRRAV